MKLLILIICIILLLPGIIINNFQANEFLKSHDYGEETADNNLESNKQLSSPVDLDKPRLISPEMSSRGTPDDNDSEPNNNMNDATKINPKIGDINFFYGNFSTTDTVDWYKFYASKGDASGNNADRFNIILSDNNTTGGVSMELFAPGPYHHKLGTSIVHVKTAVVPAIFDMVAPLNGTYYIKVKLNGIPMGPDEDYVLQYVFLKVNNSEPPSDNNFESAKWIDPTREQVTLSLQYLDPIWDVHDFYNFTGHVNQTLEVTLTIYPDVDYDLYLFDRRSVVPISWSANPIRGHHEQIIETLEKNTVYYVRVKARINGSVNQANNNGSWYSIQFKGNVPPVWQNGSKEIYNLEEDSPPIYIEPEEIWKDLNKNDYVEYLLWNPATLDWAWHRAR